jgi:hypothetical protein
VSREATDGGEVEEGEEVEALEEDEDEESALLEFTIGPPIDDDEKTPEKR